MIELWTWLGQTTRASVIMRSGAQDLWAEMLSHDIIAFK